jgi:hypothetical protein
MTILPQSELLPTLSEWRGTKARIWQYDRSLSRLVVMLSSATESRPSLFVLCVSCRYIQGPVHWEDCELVVHSNSTDVVEDLRARFRVECSGVVLIESTMAEFALDSTAE